MTLKKVRECLEDIKVIVTIVLSLVAMLGWTYQGKAKAEDEVVNTRAQVTAVANAYTSEQVCGKTPDQPVEQCVQMVRELRGIVKEWHE